MSALKDRYVNPLTDFGFKKLFEAAEIAKFSPEERNAYEDSLKYYRDLKNVVESSREEGVAEGIEKGAVKRNKEIARQMKVDGESYDLIMRYTGLSRAEIDLL